MCVGEQRLHPCQAVVCGLRRGALLLKPSAESVALVAGDLAYRDAAVLPLEQGKGQLAGPRRRLLTGLGRRPSVEYIPQGVCRHSRPQRGGRMCGHEARGWDGLAGIKASDVRPCFTVDVQALQQNRPGLGGLPVDQHAELPCRIVRKGEHWKTDVASSLSFRN